MNHNDIIEKILDGYIDCALWSSTHFENEDDTSGQSFDEFATRDDLTPVALASMREDVEGFYNDNKADIDAAIEHLKDHSDSDAYAQIGHHFWLTRNRHGAGFWDGDYPRDLGQRLTESAHIYGSSDLYLDDDGDVCVYPTNGGQTAREFDEGVQKWGLWHEWSSWQDDVIE